MIITDLRATGLSYTLIETSTTMVKTKKYTIEFDDWAACFEEDGQISWFHQHPKGSLLQYFEPYPWQDGCRVCGQQVPVQYLMMAKLQKLRKRDGKSEMFED